MELGTIMIQWGGHLKGHGFLWGCRCYMEVRAKSHPAPEFQGCDQWQEDVIWYWQKAWWLRLPGKGPDLPDRFDHTKLAQISNPGKKSDPIPIPPFFHPVLSFSDSKTRHRVSHLHFKSINSIILKCGHHHVLGLRHKDTSGRSIKRVEAHRISHQDFQQQKCSWQMVPNALPSVCWGRKSGRCDLCLGIGTQQSPKCVSNEPQII